MALRPQLSRAPAVISASGFVLAEGTEVSAAPRIERRRLHVPRRLRWALILMLLFHGGLLLMGSFRGTYDAYVHIFLGDHYARGWFDTWEERWYTGFTTVSYPPGTHMAIAGLSKIVGDLEIAFILLQIAVLELLAVGVYRFSRLWVDEDAAANAALVLVAASSIAETVHVFGQLPTTFALAFLLNAIPYIHRWVFVGRPVDLILGTVVLAACTAGHHVTTLFGSVFFLGPLLLAGLLERSRQPAPGEPAGTDPRLTSVTIGPLVARRVRRALAPLVRTAIIGPCLLGALVIVVLPYWLWSATDPIAQVPIPHGSRANFLQDLNLGLVFFAIPWGLSLFVLPYALVRAVLDRMWPLAASIFTLFVLGTGGTTPIPRLLLGPAFDILTLDRFTFWASIMILPLVGLFVSSIENGSIAGWLRRTGGRRLLGFVQAGLVIALLTIALFSATLSRFRPFQPATIDTNPIVAFIEKDQHERWRFLTLGFGDQMAWLSAQTTATQVDGNYHSARRLPELTSTSVERLEGAKYRGVGGLGSLQQFLEVPEKYHLKFVFSNDRFYDPLLHFSGWQRLGPLENGIIVWERADIPPLPAQLPSREVPPLQRLMWGIIPPAAIVSAVVLLGWAAAGQPGLRRRFDPTTADGLVMRGPVRAIDRSLRRKEALLPEDAPPRRSRRRTEHLLMRVRAWAARPVPKRKRRFRLALLVIALLALPARALLSDAPPPLPTEQVIGYFDDLDFRRFGDAYSRLDPQTRPDPELFRLQLSVNGGLLSSYSLLGEIDAEVVALDDELGRATVDVDIRYLTALDWYDVERTIDMVRRGDTWYLLPQAPDLDIPPDQLVRRPEVDYLIQGRRRVTSGTTDLTDIQDRPELQVRSANLVDVDGQPVVVGEVVNIDVDPADITVTAVLRNEFGEAIGRYNATDIVAHRLRPRESTPFLISFEEVAAGVGEDFNPLDHQPIELDEEIASVEVYAKAVVTTDGLYRGLGVHELAVVDDGEGGHVIEGELRNDGVEEATVPVVLVAFHDDFGDVVWVERVYLSGAIRSQRSGTFKIEVPTSDALRPSNLDVKVFHNGIVPAGGALRPQPELLYLPEGSDFTAISIETHAFLGGEE